MIENAFYSAAQHGEFKIFTKKNFTLKSGDIMPECHLAYAVHGSLNHDKSNAVLFPVMFSGSSGSLKHYIGENLALDPRKYCIIIPNQIGGGLSSSPHNTPPPFGMSSFPSIDISDDVRLQHHLIEEVFGIQRLVLVLGWSMGAQQTYEWAVRFPQMVARALPIAGTARCTPHDRLYVDTFCSALKSDAAWMFGEYRNSAAVEKGLRRLAQVFALMGVSSEFYQQEKWRQAGCSSMDEMLENFWQKWFLPMDANALLCMAAKWQSGDVSAGSNFASNLARSLGSIRARVDVVAFQEDMFVPVQDCRTEQQLIPRSTLHIVNSLWGHFTMMGVDKGDFQVINAIIQKLLDRDDV